MSPASLLGVIFGLGLTLLAIFISTSNPLIYFDGASVLMVIGGSIAAAYMGYQSNYVGTAFKAIWWMFHKPKSTREGLNSEIMRLIKWSYLVQQKGLPALENEIKGLNANDPLIKYCMELVITNHPPADLHKMMLTAVEAEFERKTIPVQILKGMASNAPAFGMIGTLVGLIAILESMGAGIDSLAAVVGQGMALALITTLYGVFFARMVFLPAANKLLQKEESERFRNLMMVEGLVLLADKRSPRYMQDRLNSYLDPAIHFNIDKQMRGAAPKSA
ncbi:MAG: MotA/TolQ/ExbB proton channel family protein [Alphaproteobacteria bacterium]|nr:MotA/TolQ/ExbB proton channel family protein [Alphaproteobacteria bacterium]